MAPELLDPDDPYSVYLKPAPTDTFTKEEEDFRTRTLTDLSLGSTQSDLQRFAQDHESSTKFQVRLYIPNEGKSSKKFVVTVGSRGLLIRSPSGTPLRAFYLEQIEQLTCKKDAKGESILEIDFLRPRVGNSKPFGRLALVTNKAEKIKRELMAAEEKQLLEQKK